MRRVYSVLVKWPEQPIRQHLRLSFDELFTAMCRTLFNSDSLESYGSERLSYLLGWPSLYQGTVYTYAGQSHNTPPGKRYPPSQLVTMAVDPNIKSFWALISREAAKNRYTWSVWGQKQVHTKIKS